MKSVYFISDIHLGAPSLTKDFEAKRRNELLKLFDIIAENGSRLIIVGDLFDFWYEYKYVVPKNYFWLYAKFKEMIEKGVAMDYIAGNHDFFLGEFFSKSVGLKVYQDGFSENINGKKFLIIHGDGLAVKDAGYRMLKRILRIGFTRSVIRWIHPDIGFSLAKAFSKKSREYTSNKDYGETDGMMLFAEEKLKDGYDFVVMGHNHVPKFEHFGKGVYVNLGDWLKNFTYGVFNGDAMQLVKWEFEK
ncbi:MAG: UDP-2,3-diacylglucosamine diphosphatase [Candidatus Kryptoniota bacterium]